jgi:hypothetical protein
MSAGGGVLDAQTQAMIAQLRRYESDQVGEIVDRGHASARALVASAFAEARASVAKAVRRERSRRQAAVTKSKARAETRARLDSQLRIGELLASGWAQLPEVLSERWRNPDQRQRWWQAAVAQACQRLLGESFLIEYAPGPTQRELDDMVGACGERRVSLQSAHELGAGVRITTPGAALDASVGGLLADREHIQSLLLAAYQATESTGAASDA